MILHVLLIFLTQCILQLQTRPSLPLGQRVYENDCSVPAFREYQKDFGKSLDQFDEERRNRLCTLIDAKKVHNSGASGFKMGVNGLSDLSTDEYRRRQGFAYASKKSSGKEPLPVQQSSSAQQSLPLPESIDWRKKGFTSAVKDQGNCGSSWAFAAAGAIEFAKFKKTGKVTKISEQNLIDCSKSSGCSSGNPGLAMKFIVENGVDTDKTNPYKAKEDLCTYRETKGEEKISDFEYLPEGSEEALKATVANIGPVAVGIDATLDSFRNYQSGVYFDKKCSRATLSHTVLLVGYGTDATLGDYWIIKNSWGENWGEEGYARIARNKNNHCGIASSAVYPIV